MTKLKKKKRLTIPNAGKNVEQLELSYTTDGNTALVQPLLGKSNLLKVKYKPYIFHVDVDIHPLPGTNPREVKGSFHKEKYIHKRSQHFVYNN